MSIDRMFAQANDAMRAGRFPEAERRYRALINLRPLWAWQNLGVLLSNTGRYDEALTAFEKAIEADPTANEPRHSLALLTLRLGDYPKGFGLYEVRRRMPPTGDWFMPYPEWQGEDLRDKHLLVHREQGLGDQIMLARFIPELARRAARVTYLCDAPLAPLFAANEIETAVYDRATPPPHADYWVRTYTVPIRLGLTLEDVKGAPYLSASPKPIGAEVGVKPTGGPKHMADKHRSMPPDAAAKLRALGLDLDPQYTGARDFLETAEIVAGLDLVITVDTSIAHLAGAMGKPTWVLLSALHADWRWLHGRTDSPWYDSVRIYRQREPGKWGPLLRQIMDDLAEFRGTPDREAGSS